MDDLVVALAIWFILGIAGTVWIYYDMEKNKRISGTFILAGLLLSIFGILVYYYLGRERAASESTEIAMEYAKPEYKFDEEKKVAEAPKKVVEVKIKKKEEKNVEQLEGCPRCPKCGAAISVHDIKCWDCGAQLRVA